MNTTNDRFHENIHQVNCTCVKIDIKWHKKNSNTNKQSYKKKRALHSKLMINQNEINRKPGVPHVHKTSQLCLVIIVTPSSVYCHGSV